MAVRQVCPLPFILDETIDTLRDLVGAVAEGGLNAVVIKLSHVGGLTKALDMARLVMRLGLMVRIEDRLGAEIVRAAVAHLAETIPEKSILGTYWHTASTSLGRVDVVMENGRMGCG